MVEASKNIMYDKNNALAKVDDLTVKGARVPRGSAKAVVGNVEQAAEKAQKAS